MTRWKLTALTLVATMFALLAPSSTLAGPSKVERERATSAVFYAGLKDAGFDVGTEWGATTMGYDRDPQWRSSRSCSSSGAIPSVRHKIPNRLVGFSVGRLGPAYYLQQHEQRGSSWGHIRTIALIDPGSKDNISGNDGKIKSGCDYKTGAGATLREWLKSTPGSRLLIIAGPSTQDDYDGLKVAYLKRLREVRRWVRVCQTTKLKSHHQTASSFGWLLGTWDRTFAGCPENTEHKKDLWGKEDAAIAGQGGTDDRKHPSSGSASANAPGSNGGAGNAVPTSRGAVSLSRGPAAPKGYRYAISLSGYTASSAVTISCHDSVDPGGFYSFSLTTDGGGNASTAAHCYSGDGPDHWVVAGGVESNHVSWGGSSTTPRSPAPATTWNQQQGSLGANTFTNPYNASGMGPKIPAMSWVAVSCKVYAPQIASANPDGYWYRIASAPWNNAYYAVANTFWNGDVPGQRPYTHNTDHAVANC